MLPETVRLTQPTKEHLLRLKRTTGIKHWNVLSRWAFCVSLTDQRPLAAADASPASNVEMTWKVFAGPHADAYGALLQADAERRSASPADLATVLTAHIRRGAGLLVLEVNSLSTLVSAQETSPRTS